MGDIIYLAAAYAVFWAVTFILVFSIASRQKKVQKDLEMLEQLALDDAGTVRQDAA